VLLGRVAIGALSYAISILEPTVEWLVESRIGSRIKATLSLCVAIWFVGLGTVFSFNHWADYTLFGKTFFDSLDFLTANIMLPLGGLLIAIFVGWFMKPEAIVHELGPIDQGAYKYWLRVLRYVSPVLLAIVFVKALLG